MGKKFLLAIALSVLLIFAYGGILCGQEHSTQGTDFWLTFMENSSGAQVTSVIISAEKACTGTITNPRTNYSNNFSIGDNGLVTIELDKDHCYLANSYDVATDKGIHIVSTDLISVFSLNYKNASFDGSNILPTEALRSNYIIQTYKPDNRGSEFCIVATEDDTDVEITPTATTTSNHYANVKYTIHLNRGQTYQVHTNSYYDDFSGTTVNALNDKKIAVFAGNQGTNIPSGYSANDHVYEQMPPIEYWGKKFALTKTVGSNADMIKVTAFEDGTNVMMNGSIISNLNAKQSCEFEFRNDENSNNIESAYLESDKPILVSLYITGHNHRGDKDPSMVIINPIEQVVKDVIFATYMKDTYLDHYVNIVTKTDVVSSVKLDGNSISNDFSTLIGNSELSFARKKISHSTHKLECEHGLIAHVYGIGDNESYAYSVGSSIRHANGIDTVLVNDSICFGENYTLHGFNYINPEVGTYTDTITYKDEYDVTAFYDLTLTVNPTYDTTFYDTICYGYGYHQHGFDRDSLWFTVGWNYDTINPETILECDSIVYLELYVAPIYDTTFYDTICFNNQPYQLHGFDLDSLTVGTHYDTMFLESAFGCDSIVMLELYVAPIYDTTFYDTICYGYGYHEHGFDRDSLSFTVGWNFDTINPGTILGCDSLVYLELYVAPIYDTTFYDTICYGYGYHQHGFDRDSLWFTVGWNYDTINPGTILECDSIVYLELYVAPIYDTTLYDTICFNNQPYQLHGFDLDSLLVGWNYDTINPGTILGCDSLVYLELYVAPIYDTTFYDTICYNEQPYQLHGFDLDGLPLGMRFDTINPETILSCDSLVYLELYVAPIYDTTLYDTICYGYGYHQHGFDRDSLWFTVGWNYDTINPGTVLGCDSLIYLELYVAPVYDTTFYDTICYGYGYHEHGFDRDSLSFTVGWNYDSINPGTVLGCDSLVYLELYVAPIYDTTFNEHICFGNPYQLHGFDLDSLPVGMHYDTINSETVLGCDSIVYLELYVAPLYDTLFQDTACINEGYHLHGFEIDSLGLGLNYDTLYLSSIYGCDSIVMLEVYANPIYDTTFYDTICYGYGYHQHGFDIDSLSLAVGMNYYNINPGTVLGCDSIVYLELYVAPVYDINIYDSICFGENYNQYNFDTVAPAPGLCLMQQQLVTGIGCDSIVTLKLFVGEVFDITIHDTICYGNDYDKYNFHLVNPPVGDNSETQSLSTMYSCDSIVNLDLYVAPVYSFNVVDSICEGEDYNNYGLFIPQPVPGVHNYTSLLTTELGCDSIFNVNFKVIYSFTTPDTIYGLHNVFVSTDILPGKYRYWVDTITGCRDYHWELDNDDWLISTNKNECIVTVTTPEVSTLTMWAGNSCGSVSKSIEITAGYFSVDENGDINVNVYPNPSNGYVNVEGDGIEAVNILSATGVVVKKLKYDDENLISIDINDLPNAIYVLEIVTRDGKCMRRVTKTGF